MYRKLTTGQFWSAAHRRAHWREDESLMNRPAEPSAKVPRDFLKGPRHWLRQSPVLPGAILFAGRPIADLPAHAISRLGMARTFQHIDLVDELSVRLKTS